MGRGHGRRVHHYAANSAYVAGRIRRYYGRESVVIPPPVDTDFFTPDDRPPGRLTTSWSPPSCPTSASSCPRGLPRARPAAQDRGQGSGGRAAARAGRPRDRVPRAPSDDLALRELYRGCRAVLMASVEDFGIVPLEAMACGRPAVVFAEGGGGESVLPGRDRRAIPRSLRRPRCAPPLTHWRGCVLISARSEPAPRPTAASVFEARFRAFVEEALVAGLAPRPSTTW